MRQEEEVVLFGTVWTQEFAILEACNGVAIAPSNQHESQVRSVEWIEDSEDGPVDRSTKGQQ